MKLRAAGATLPPRKSAVSRADLLWLLHTQPADDVRQAAVWLGFRYQEPHADPLSSAPAPRPLPPTPPGPAAAGRQPLRCRQFAVIEHQHFAEEAVRPDDTAAPDDGEVYTSLAGAVVDPPQPIALSPPRRLAVFLAQTLRTSQPGREIDLVRLLTDLARVRLPRRLPRRRQPRWSGEAALVVDLSLAAWPLQNDLCALAEQAHALSGGRLPVYCHEPQHGWLRRRPGRAPMWARVDANALCSARHWLIAGDCCSLVADPQSWGDWPARCRAHLAAGGQVTLLTGRPRVEATRRLPRNASVVAWEHGRRLLAERSLAACRTDEAATVRLLAALSLAVVVEPALLRELRLALGVSLACELAAWNHVDSQPCLLGTQIRHERLADYRQRLRGEPPALRQRLAEIIVRHHAGGSLLIRLEEAALAADLADFATVQARAGWAQAVRTLQCAPQGDAARELARYLERTGLRAHDSLWQAIPSLADAYVLARRDALQAGAPIPSGLPASSLARYLAPAGPAGEARRWWLVQRAAELVATLQPPQGGAFLLAAGEPVAGFDLQAPKHARRWQPLLAAGQPLATLQAGSGPWIVRSTRERIVVGEVPRPSWALAWGRDRQGLYALAPTVTGTPLRLYWNADDAAPATWPPSARGFRASRQQIARGLWQGADLAYGLYLDLEIAGVVQRFRWIEAGEFSMGSPEDEAGRDADEGPRHRVRLTVGYWLAETACTQALWQAVMRNNPSRFGYDPEKPVERVSWYDVRGFLRRVQATLSGVEAALPSEAEWEYACRAGSETAYAWGGEITNEDANHAGQSSGTLPVKSYPPNAWGLYEMHGNVWEWCADGRRRYDGGDQKNPRGPEGNRALRVVRGGSWVDEAGWLRSAYRSGWHHDDRDVDLGFRFALRSTRSGGAAGAERLR